MAVDVNRFIELRPHLYHVTSAAKLPRIRSQRRLESAAALLTRAGLLDLVARQRTEQHLFTIDGMEVSLPSQEPLREGNIEFAEGWTFSHVVALLNQRVFFWPGSYMRHGPSDHGLRHHQGYGAQTPAVLRVPTNDLLKTNSDNPPEFCRYHSGAPRRSRGRRSPRGPDTFLKAVRCGFLEREVVEVAFVEKAILPDSTTLRRYSWTSWDPLFEAEDRVERAVAVAFPQDQRAAVLEALWEYAGSEPTRVRLGILALANGDADAVAKLVRDANVDFRDILSGVGRPEK